MPYDEVNSKHLAPCSMSVAIRVLVLDSSPCQKRGHPDARWPASDQCALKSLVDGPAFTTLLPSEQISSGT